MIGRGTADTLWQEGAAIEQLIKNEILTLQKQQRVLRTQGKTGYITITTLILCILLNFFFLIGIGDYFALFIVASFYLHMIYFITLLIPLGEGVRSLPVGRIRQFFSTLYHDGIIPTTDRFTHIFLDIFFINARALFAGFLVIFSFDLLFAAIGYIRGIFSTITAGVILFQSIAILVFYFMVWRFEPYSIRFQKGILGLKGRFVTRRYRSWVITLIFSSAAVLVLLMILSTIILLPGFTVNALLSLTGLEDMGNLILLIALMVTSQYFILRFFHGISSERMAVQFSDAKIASLQSTRTGDGAECSALNAPHNAAPSADAMREAAGVLLESKIYRVEVRTIFGIFPVSIVNPDFSVLFDEQVITAITGFFKHAGSSEIDRH